MSKTILFNCSKIKKTPLDFSAFSVIHYNVSDFSFMSDLFIIFHTKTMLFSPVFIFTLFNFNGSNEIQIRNLEKALT